MLLTLNVAKVLAVMDSDGDEHYGLGLTKVTGMRSGNLYPILARLHDEGAIVCTREESAGDAFPRRPRRYYRITVEGSRRAVDARSLIAAEASILNAILASSGDPAAVADPAVVAAAPAQH